MKIPQLLCSLLICVGVFPVYADVTLPALFSDNMVLQRETPIPVWGKADPGEKVTVALDGDQATAITAADGRWQAALKPHAAGGPYTLTMTGKNALTRRNVLVGDVWLCGGQSNMEFTLKRASNAAEAIAVSADPDLRLFKVRTAKPSAPADDVAGSWNAAGPDTTGGFSAIGYFFGHAIRAAEHVPIGLISSNVGGTPAQSWTGAEVLNASPDLKQRYVDSVAVAQTEHDAAMTTYDAALAKATTDGTKPPQKPYGFWLPSVLYNGMIAPLTPFPIRGVLWYQGESNTHDPVGYRSLLPAMICDWRVQWHEPNLPFLIVQLAPFGSQSGNDTAWAETREAQQMAVQTLPDTALAVTTDVGMRHEIHYTDKQPVGERLALLARKLVYGEKDLVASGPAFHSLRIDGSRAVLTFDSAGDGLTVHGGEASGVTVPADALVGFTLAGADGKFVPAEAKIVGSNTVEVNSPQVTRPAAVRYGFVNFPVVNLWNKNGLPAVPFRTDAPMAAHADTPLTILAKHKPADSQWKSYPVRTIAQLTPLPAEPALDQYGGRMDKSGPKTGFFHTQQSGGRWWLVDPDGHLYLNTAAVNVSLGPTPDPHWAQNATRLLRENGFSGAGAWSSTRELRAVAAPLVYTLIGHSGLANSTSNGFMSSFASSHHLLHPGTGRSEYPYDCIPVFHPDFAAYCDDYTKPLAVFKDDPFLLGYFSDNELPLPVLDKYLALDPKDPQTRSSYAAARAWLDARKGKAAAATDITDADRDAWTGYVFDCYFTLTTSALRKYDPNHLCLGSRLNSRSAGLESVFRAAGRSLDVISINYYGVWDPSLPSVRQRTVWADRPLLVSEFYAKGVDSGFANTGGAGWLVATQHDRGLFYQTFTLGLLEAKNCVGWQWFKYMDNDPNNHKADPSNRDSNKGIVKIDNTPYLPLIDEMRPLNRNIYALADKFDQKP